MSFNTSEGALKKSLAQGHWSMKSNMAATERIFVYN